MKGLKIKPSVSCTETIEKPVMSQSVIWKFFKKNAKKLIFTRSTLLKHQISEIVIRHLCGGSLNNNISGLCNTIHSHSTNGWVKSNIEYQKENNI